MKRQMRIDALNLRLVLQRLDRQEKNHVTADALRRPELKEI
jgi:hypothetical protein